MDISVELRPHKGMVDSPLGPTEIELPQVLVIAKTPSKPNGVHVAYIGTDAPGRPFNGLEVFTRMAEADRQKIIALANAQLSEKNLGGDRKVFSEPLTPEEPDEDDDDADEDEE